MKIGCESKTIKDWDKWFEGKEEFETKRGTQEFKEIELAFQYAKKLIKLKEGK